MYSFYLTPISQDLLVDFLEWRNSYEYRYFCRSGVPVISSVEELQHELQKQYSTDLFKMLFGIYEDYPVSMVWAYRHSSINNTCYVSLYTPNNTTNKLIAIRTFIYFCEFLFEKYAMRKIYFEVRSDNNFCIPIMEKVNFNLEARFVDHCETVDGSFCDLLIFALQKEVLYNNPIYARFNKPSHD